MLKLVFENYFVSINHDDNINASEIKWKRKYGNIIDESQNHLLKEISELVKQIAPQKLLANMSECNYPITTETDSGHKNPLFKIFSDLPPSRMAVVIP